MGPPEKETPHPSTLGGRRGNAGSASTGMDGRANHSPAVVKARRGLRFRAQGQANRWLTGRARAIKPDAHPGDVYRTASCMWSRIADVEIWRSDEFATAHYRGLATCGSVWACPVCASKIQERRRAEVDQAMTWANAQALEAMMVTLTFPHRSFHRLRDLLERQADALGRFRRSRAYQRLMKRLGFSGLIRSLEVTHGSNGWHPHTHELWFVRPEQQAGIRDELAVMWAAACRSAGLLTSNDDARAFHVHSVDVKHEVTSGDYLAKQDDSRKWGFADEISKATSKQGRAKGVHPHEFLVRAGLGDDALYFEYIDSMKGRRQLFWSHGLKASVGVGDVSDEEVAEAAIESAHHVYTLPKGAWDVVRGNDARAELLNAVDDDGSQGAVALLRSLGHTTGEGDERSSCNGNSVHTKQRPMAGRSGRGVRIADASAGAGLVRAARDAVARFATTGGSGSADALLPAV